MRYSEEPPKLAAYGDTFKKSFGEDLGEVLSAAEAMKRLDIDASELLRLWRESSYSKLAT